VRLNEISDTDPVLEQWLLKLHKGAVAGFNAKTATAVLGLFDGWTVSKQTFIKPSDRGDDLQKISIEVVELNHWTKKVEPRRISLHAWPRGDTTLQVVSHSKAEATALHAKVAQYVVARLPEPEKAKPDQFFIMNLTTPEVTKSKNDGQTWTWSFDLYRKCNGYRITAPDGQHFDVCGPTKVLGYTGTKDFSAFFKWALANTDLEAQVNARLGIDKHVKASERPRVPVGGQTIGTCAICFHEQVVRGDQMVLHGYQRPGHGYIIGNCFGVGYKPYELSADACVAYVPNLEAHKTHYTENLAALKQGKVSGFKETERDYRTGRDVVVITKKGDAEYPRKLAAAIANAEQQIRYVTQDITEMHKRIDQWKPVTLRRVEGLPCAS